MNIEILKHLRNEHRNIESLLCILERQLASIESGDRPDYQLMYDIAHYLTYYLDHYHHPYEDLIYARLAEKCPELSHLVAGIEKQHQQIALKGNKLRDLIGGIIHGSVFSRGTVVRIGLEYINTYRAHLQTEEHKVFDKLAVNLDTADWMLLISAFHWRPDPVFSEEVSSEYQHLRDCITLEGAGDWPWNDAQLNYCSACSSTDTMQA